MLAIESQPITPQHTTALLHDELAAMEHCGRVLKSPAQQHRSCGHCSADRRKVSYASKIDKSESHLNWQDNANTLERKIRAFDPAPGLRGQKSMTTHVQNLGRASRTQQCAPTRSRHGAGG